MNLAVNLVMASKPELATHLLLDRPGNRRAICGTDVGIYVSWWEHVTFRQGVYMNPNGFCEKDPKHYIDCRRCAALLAKYRPTA